MTAEGARAGTGGHDEMPGKFSAYSTPQETKRIVRMPCTQLCLRGDLAHFKNRPQGEMNDQITAAKPLLPSSSMTSTSNPTPNPSIAPQDFHHFSAELALGSLCVALHEKHHRRRAGH